MTKKELKNTINCLNSEQKKTYDKFIKQFGLFSKFSDEQKYQIALAVYNKIPLNQENYNPNKTDVEMYNYTKLCCELTQKISQLNPDQKQVILNHINAYNHGFNPYQINMLYEAVVRDINISVLTPQLQENVMCNYINDVIKYKDFYNRLTPNQQRQFDAHMTVCAQQYARQFDSAQAAAMIEAFYYGDKLSKYTPNIHHANMEMMVAKQYLQSANLREDRAFLDHVNPANLPIQGWKIHFSCDTAKDYLEAIKIMVPELIRNNIQFKIVNPECYQYEYSPSNLFGKEFTIYPNQDFKLENFSKAFMDCLNKNVSRHPHSDKSIGGRANARYGAFRLNGNYIYNGYGQPVTDNRSEGVFKPDFVDDASIADMLTFYSRIEEKYRSTGDLKLYVQEALTGREYNSFDKYFVDSFIVGNPNIGLELQHELGFSHAFYTEFNGMYIISTANEKDRQELIDCAYQRGYVLQEIQGNSLYQDTNLGLVDIKSQQDIAPTMILSPNQEINR